MVFDRARRRVVGLPAERDLRNTGDGPLRNLVVSVTGTDAASYSVNTAGMSTTLAPAATTSFTIHFAPTGLASGSRAAVLQVFSNDADENPFDINLAGLALSTTADADGDSNT